MMPGALGSPRGGIGTERGGRSWPGSRIDARDNESCAGRLPSDLCKCSCVAWQRLRPMLRQLLLRIRTVVTYTER